MSNQPLKGKTALITGGGRGIGLGISQSFLLAGASLIVAQRSALPAELNEHPDVYWIEINLAQHDSYGRIAEFVQQTSGTLDVLVNNAGIMFERSLDNMQLAEWEQMIGVNLTAPVFLVKHLLPLLRQNGGGNIINIGSIEGIDANPQHTAYCATKGGVHAMTKAMAVDLGIDNIRCNAIAPGWIRSSLSDDYINAQENPESSWQDLYKLHPLGRIGEPTDVGKLAIFLASDDAAFITGQIIVLDGGRTSKLPLPF